jgi:hypothetical protein
MTQVKDAKRNIVVVSLSLRPLFAGLLFRFISAPRRRPFLHPISFSGLTATVYNLDNLSHLFLIKSLVRKPCHRGHIIKVVSVLYHSPAVKTRRHYAFTLQPPSSVTSSGDTLHISYSRSTAIQPYRSRRVRQRRLWSLPRIEV